MTNQFLPEFIIKHGVTGVLIAWLFITNDRLSDVEERLYRCYERTPTHSMPVHVETDRTDRTELLAVLPKKFKIKIS